MCLHPSWARALAAAQRLHDLARLRQVRDRIDREYRRPLTVEALARGVGMPAGRLSQEFLLAYGKTPNAYLLSRRAEQSTALLRHDGLSPAEPRDADCFAWAAAP
jgi:AraC-like DNA-binding protein